MKSYLESTARERIRLLLDAGSFKEFLPPEQRVTSPHLAQLDAPVSFDDGVIVGCGLLHGKAVFAAAQEGAFMGGAVGEVHGAKLVGMLQRTAEEHAEAVLLLLETGGVRLHAANAGQIAVFVQIGYANGLFGCMGIVAFCANKILMTEVFRLGMSGPEVIVTAHGVE